MLTEGAIACLVRIALKNEELCCVFPPLEYISFAACNIQILQAQQYMKQ